MFRTFEFWVAARYLKSRNGDGFISLIAWFSLIGIALGVATLIIVLSVMNGFRHELLTRVLGINGHISIEAKVGQSGIDNFDEAIKAVLGLPDITVHLSDLCKCFCKLIDDLELRMSSFNKKPLP